MNFAFCFDMNWWAVAGVAIASLLSTQGEPVDVYCVTASDVPEYAKARLREIANSISRRSRIEFVPATNDFAKDPTMKNITGAMYYRLLLPRLLLDLDRVFYADCDVVFASSVRPAYDVEFGSNLMAAVREPLMSELEFAESFSGLPVWGGEIAYQIRA
jgi:lipopolysaccharide biosynthesis glycosyltransferase